MSILKGVEVRRPIKREAPYVRTLDQIVDNVIPLSPDKSRFDWFAHDPEAKAAIHVKNGAYDKELSVNEVLLGGEIEDNKAKSLRIESSNGKIGGCFAEGAGNFEVDGAYISLSGDAAGIGGPATGAAAMNGADLTIRNAVIDVSGLTHYATAAERGSILRVYDSVLGSHGAPFANGEPQPSKPMQVPPPPLMIAGNSRTHCTMTGSQSFFYNSTIVADGWGALSTEAAEGYVYIEANDCRIATVRRGYAAYADPGCHVNMYRCEIDSADMAGIIGGEANMDFIDCDTRCGSVFMLMHSVFGEPDEVSYVTVSGGQVRSKAEAFMIKSLNTEVLLEDADIKAENGVLIRSILNDDFLATKVGPDPYGTGVTLRDMNACGDILHEDGQREMWLTLQSSTVNGVIRNAHLFMDMGSRWFAPADSEVVLVGEANVAQFDAPKGVTIRVHGDAVGTYELVSGGILEMIK